MRRIPLLSIAFVAATLAASPPCPAYAFSWVMKSLTVGMVVL